MPSNHLILYCPLLLLPSIFNFSLWASNSIPRHIPRESHSLKRHMHQSVRCSTIYYNTMCCFVTKSCQNLCDSMDCSLPGFPVPHHLPEFDQVQVHWISDAIQPSHPLSLSSSCLQFFPTSGSFPMSHLFISGGQSIGASALASVLPKSIQGWFPLRLTGLISLLSKGLFFTPLLHSHQEAL